jgi:hypothetical protein
MAFEDLDYLVNQAIPHLLSYMKTLERLDFVILALKIS